MKNTHYIEREQEMLSMKIAFFKRMSYLIMKSPPQVSKDKINEWTERT